MTLIIPCPDCADEAPGFRYTSRYGGNDPDVWLVPCETCGGSTYYKEAGTGTITLICEGWRCEAEADEMIDTMPLCSTHADEYRREIAEDVFGEVQ